MEYSEFLAQAPGILHAGYTPAKIARMLHSDFGLDVLETARIMQTKFLLAPEEIL